MNSIGHATPSGLFSPLRYPGGKGKLARFVADVLRLNALQDGIYVEPYAGGAAVALELLITGLVRRIAINDLSFPIFTFWQVLLNQTDELISLISDTNVDMDTRAKVKRVLSSGSASGVELAFATFFLNRTNRSGILNGGAIGGINQNGPWKIDARYNKRDLINRIKKISQFKKRITVTNLDAVFFLEQKTRLMPRKTLIYLDPPYYNKGRELYYNFYQHGDHANVARATHKLDQVSWIVSYDDVPPISALYQNSTFLKYTIGYSAREKVRGAEAMFFSPGMLVPPVRGSMIEIERGGDADSQTRPSPADPTSGAYSAAFASAVG